MLQYENVKRSRVKSGSKSAADVHVDIHFPNFNMVPARNDDLQIPYVASKSSELPRPPLTPLRRHKTLDKTTCPSPATSATIVSPIREPPSQSIHDALVVLDKRFPDSGFLDLESCLRLLGAAHITQILSMDRTTFQEASGILPIQVGVLYEHAQAEDSRAKKVVRTLERVRSGTWDFDGPVSEKENDSNFGSSPCASY